MTGILSGRVALITGASRGIGAAVAVRFAAEGARVVLAARTRGGLEDVDDAIRSGGRGAATLLELDLAEPDSADGIGPALANRFGRLDILVANAGYLGELAPIHQFDDDLWSRAMAVNLDANRRLIRGLDPLLRASDAGRAIFVTSDRIGRPYWGAYAAGKAALEAVALCWAAETRRTGMRINLVDPGATRTRLRSEAYPGEDPATLKAPEAVAGVFVDLAAPDCRRHGEIVRA